MVSGVHEKKSPFRHKRYHSCDEVLILQGNTIAGQVNAKR